MTPDDRAVAPVAPACPRPCRWHACTAQRTGSLWCDQHAYAEQAVQEGYPWAAVRDRMIGLADEVSALIGLADGL